MQQKKNPPTCRCCGAKTSPAFTGVLIGHQVGYFDCPDCGYVQTDAPYWLDQAYADAINDSDTGILVRNWTNARIVIATLLALGSSNGNVVDCAGGYGILVRLLRDLGLNAFWSDRYCQNLLAKGFEHSNEKATLVTAFEAFEHFIDPAAELDKLLAIAPNILISTELIASPAPRHEDWWYYGKHHGQHIGFFRLQTLAKLAKSRGRFLLSDGKAYHLITSKPVSPLRWRVFLKLGRCIVQFRHKSFTVNDHDYIKKKHKHPG
jgi:hypothetical protein